MAPSLHFGPWVYTACHVNSLVLLPSNVYVVLYTSAHFAMPMYGFPQNQNHLPSYTTDVDKMCRQLKPINTDTYAKT